MLSAWLEAPLLVVLLVWVLTNAAAQRVGAPQILPGAAGAGPPEVQRDSTGLPPELASLDWAQRSYYAADNARLPPPAPGERRVVFMGNSITEGWADGFPALFAAHPTWVNRGIGGQTTEQMLVRFRADVIALRPAVVVIAAGINDIAGNTGYSSEDDTFGHIVSMVQLARANGIDVVLQSVLPAWEIRWRRGIRPAQRVVRLNERLRAFAKTEGIVYLDGFALLADERPGIRAGLHTDEVHLTPAGYAVLAKAVEDSVAEALAQH